ncbi:potassium channel family protein [Fundidesulfovibrio agrisoli]|uniref:potassium channel family protein n=1 Tax=Fundidesulfovibrio agrisoli TaxID=2922717 RepID=UPI001FAB6BD7|nr:potassium channel family protein [Fundidesulfovibrio agrisoli]
MPSPWAKLTESPFTLPLTLMAAILAVSAAGFWWFESGTQAEPVGFFEGLWWAMVTLFTVGYGDFAPKTVPGRLLGMGVMASGIGLVSVLTGTMASAMVERQTMKRRGLLRLDKQGHILILGWNSHGRMLVEHLRRLPDLSGAPVVLASEMDPAEFEQEAEAMNLGPALSFVRGNPAHRAVLERANPAKARLAYILAADDIPGEEADNLSVLTALTLRSLAPDLTVYAEAMHDQSRDHLVRAGVTKVLGREELTGRTLAFMASHPVMHDVLRALLGGLPGVGKGGYFRYRPMSAAEKKSTWVELVRQSLEASGQLPLGVCRLPRELRLSDVLDASEGLDRFVMELIQTSGQSDSLGQRGSEVVLNPGPELALEGYDGIVFMDRKS